MRSMIPRSFGSSWCGYRRRVVFATLTMRSALRSSSCADAHHRHEEPQVGGERLLAREQQERAVLDGVGELVDHVVGFDDAFGRVEVAVEQRLRAARDRLGGERGETDDVDAQLVEVSRGTPCAPRRRRALGNGCGRSRRLQLAEGGCRRCTARLRSVSILPRDRRVRACRTLGRGQSSVLVYLPATIGQRDGNRAPVRWWSTENGSRIPPPRAVPGCGSSRLGVRGREGLERRVRGRELPPSRPHALRQVAGQGRASAGSPPDPPLTGVLAGHHEVHLLGDRHRVVADALVVARDERELHRVVQRAVVAARRRRRPRARGGTAASRARRWCRPCRRARPPTTGRGRRRR